MECTENPWADGNGVLLCSHSRYPRGWCMLLAMAPWPLPARLFLGRMDNTISTPPHSAGSYPDVVIACDNFTRFKWFFSRSTIVKHVPRGTLLHRAMEQFSS